MRSGPTKFRTMSTSPATRAFVNNVVPGIWTYWTSVNPSPCKRSPARNRGDKQREGVCPSLSLVVSGGGSAATDSDFRPRSPAAPARTSPLRNSRRLQPSACRLFMGISFMYGAVERAAHQVRSYQRRSTSVRLRSTKRLYTRFGSGGTETGRRSISHCADNEQTRLQKNVIATLSQGCFQVSDRFCIQGRRRVDINMGIFIFVLHTGNCYLRLGREILNQSGKLRK